MVEEIINTTTIYIERITIYKHEKLKSLGWLWRQKQQKIVSCLLGRAVYVCRSCTSQYYQSQNSFRSRDTKKKDFFFVFHGSCQLCRHICYMKNTGFSFFISELTHTTLLSLLRQFLFILSRGIHLNWFGTFGFGSEYWRTFKF